jgi:hypothetical protein
MFVAAVILAWAGCGEATTPETGAPAAGGATGDGGGGSGGSEPPMPDACEDVPFDGQSCCDAGCAPSTSPGGDLTCVDLDRHCFFESSTDVWEKACPPGYVCALHPGTNTMDPCKSGEFAHGAHGYCYWVDEGEP